MADQTPGRKRLMRWIGYTVLVLVVYAVVLWRVLPYSELARTLEAELRARGVGFEIQELGPGPLLGCSAESVTLFPPQFPDLRWQLTDAELRFLPQRLLAGKRAVGLNAKTLSGAIEGTALLQTPQRFEVHWQGVQLNQLPLPAAVQELSLQGQSAGSLDTTDVDPDDPSRARGFLEARFQGVGIGAGTVQGIGIPAVQLGDGTVSVQLANGRVEIETAEFKNGDLEVGFAGSVLLRQDLTRSLVNGILTLRPNDQVARDLGLLFALFPGGKGSDGRYTARVRGSLGAPRLLKR